MTPRLEDTAMQAPGTLLLTRSDVARVLTLRECIAAVEEGFRLEGRGEIQPPSILGVHTPNGGLHVKAGYLGLDRPCIVAKVNANFPHNPRRNGLPTVQGVVIVVDGDNGYPLAIMDSIEITIQRTGAATAVAARYLARRESRRAAIVGCGVQGRVQLRSLLEVLPLDRVAAYDIDQQARDRFAAWVRVDLKLDARTADSVSDAVRDADVVATCTPSAHFVLNSADVRPGMFVAAVGADSEHKWEIDPRVFSTAKVVVDNLNQCARIGDLHHAIEHGVVTRDAVHADLGSIAAGKKPGRDSADEITLFDSTGIALQDAVTGVLVLRRAAAEQLGRSFDLFA
jgi:alanine dehydrogenase